MTSDGSAFGPGLDASNLINSRRGEIDAGVDNWRFHRSPDLGALDDIGDEAPATEGATVPRRTVEQRFGDAILRLRLYLGWSQRDLQRASGVHQSQISRLESGHGNGSSSRRVFAILRALHVGDIAFMPPRAAPPTALEIMLRGDPWERAGRAVERRINRRRSGGR